MLHEITCVLLESYKPVDWIQLNQIDSASKTRVKAGTIVSGKATGNIDLLDREISRHN